MTDDPRVEAVAGALFEASTGAAADNYDWPDLPEDQKQDWRASARAAIAAADKAAWRPISEAPEDGRELDLRFPNPYGGSDMVHVGAWHTGEGAWKALFKDQGQAEWRRGDCEPTHFRYRPAVR